MDEQSDRQMNKSGWVEVREFKGLGREPIGTVPLRWGRGEKSKWTYFTVFSNNDKSWEWETEKLTDKLRRVI